MTSSTDLNFRALVSHRFHLVNRLSERTLETELSRRFGLRLLECRIIGIVGSVGPMNLTSLCGHGHFEPSHATRLVAGLIRRGLVVTRPDPGDRRSAIVYLTDAGRAMHRQIYDVAADLNERWLAGLSRGQRDALAECLDALMNQAAILVPEAADEMRAAIDHASPAEAARGPAVELDPDAALALYMTLGDALVKSGRLPARRHVS